MTQFLILQVACFALVYGSPYEKEDDMYGDYSEKENNQDAVIMGTPKFITEPLTLMANEGEIIRLPCKVDRLEGFVMLWKKNMNIITVGKQIVDKSVRVEEDRNSNTLVIGPASPSDEAEYSCQISAYKPTEITHIVKIRVRPVISVTPEKIVVNEGDPASFSCKVEAGSPAPKVHWRRRDHTMPGGEETIAGTSITFPRVTRHHSGHYICEADNGFSQLPESKEVRLEVHHAPHIEPLKSQLSSSDGRKEEKITCLVHSSPKAVVTWTKNGVEMDRNTPGIVMDNHGSHNTIILVGIDDKNFGVFACEAVNVYGKDRKEMEVSGLAKPPTFTSSGFSPHRDSYTLAWEVESHSPISAFRVSYRETGSREWITMEVEPSSSSTSSTWLGSSLLSHLNPATQYQAKVQSRNSFGFSQSHEHLNFATKGAVPFHSASISSSPFIFPSIMTLFSAVLVTVINKAM